MRRDEDDWKRVMAGFVAVIMRTPAASDYVRDRSKQMQRDGVSWPVAIFQAMAEYVEGNPINPETHEFTFCRQCGDTVRIYKGRGGWPDMWHCPACNVSGICKNEGSGDYDARAAWLYE